MMKLGSILRLSSSCMSRGIVLVDRYGCLVENCWLHHFSTQKVEAGDSRFCIPKYRNIETQSWVPEISQIHYMYLSGTK
jgi:hypothetical protein